MAKTILTTDLWKTGTGLAEEESMRVKIIREEWNRGWGSPRQWHEESSPQWLQQPPLEPLQPQAKEDGVSGKEAEVNRKSLQESFNLL